MTGKRKKRITACILAWILAAAVMGENVYAAGISYAAAGTAAVSGGDNYAAYAAAGSFAAGRAALLVSGDDFLPDGSTASLQEIGGEYPAACRLEKGEIASFSVNLTEDSAYTLILLVAGTEASAVSYAYALTIDGEAPFSECGDLSVNALWQDDGGVRELANGDQMNPSQKKVEGFVSRAVEDAKGLVLNPYVFNLSAGKHTLSVRAKDQPFLLAGIRLVPPEETKPYAQIAVDYQGLTRYEGDPIVIEAEKPLWKSAYSLTSKSDASSAGVSPSSASRALINYIGGSTWRNPGEEIAWEIKVPEDGLYKMGFAYKQGFVNHGQVYRQLKIDGKTPFQEAEAVSFSYTPQWSFQSLTDEHGTDCLLYLTRGRHTLSLTVTLADVAEVFSRLSAVTEPLGSLYLDMVMITGESPDPNRDYELQKQIPGFEESLKKNEEMLSALAQEIGVTLHVNGEMLGAVKNMARILRSMHDNLYEAHSYISSYYTAYQTLCAWLYDMMNMSLSLDQIVLASPDKEFETPAATFAERAAFGILKFLRSFTADYNSVDNRGNPGAPTIKIWVNWGRDQVKVLNTLIGESFTPQKGINVLVQQVNATVVQGVISGNSPDLYLHQARSEPVNLAMRGVLSDLKSFADYEEVLKNFQPDAELPYLYRGGCYALPDTQAFYVMFYRTDILEALGIAPPTTWEEFLSATGMLQRNKMNAYLPYVRITAATTVNTGAGGLSIFPTMLMQNGGNVYNEAQNATGLSSAASAKAFDFWTKFYTRYSLDQDANFYQKFRVGTIPLGVATYTQYLTFRVTAPEIEGKWRIAQLPGEVSDQGLNNVCSGSGTGCSIVKSSKNQEAAWKFLKWWVSEETQYRYSAETEAILGESGRTATSNVAALSRLSWDSDSLEVINAQWEKVREIPEVPGSYFVSRSIDQAFWAVKNGKKSASEAIADWSEICDKEIARKLKEYAG